MRHTNGRICCEGKLLMKSNVLVIIPAYNEEKTIRQTINKLINTSNFDYIVVNDGSLDRTKEILSTNHFHHLNLPVNMGIGGAMQTGYKYALEKGYTYAIQLDADGQHDPKDLKKLYEEIQRNECDMVIGSRFIEKTGYRGSFVRRIGIYYFSMILRFVTRLKITDPTSGYRIVNRKIIKEFSNYYPIDYPEVEVLVQLSQKKFKIKEIKVEMKARQGGKSSITPLKSTYYMAKVTFFSLIRSVF
jgi:glycosyltransferase involved in cell wall biosynthesis